MTTLKENTELQNKVDEDEEDIDSLTEKNRQLVKQVCTNDKTLGGERVSPVVCPQVCFLKLSKTFIFLSSKRSW